MAKAPLRIRMSPFQRKRDENLHAHVVQIEKLHADAVRRRDDALTNIFARDHDPEQYADWVVGVEGNYIVLTPPASKG